MLLDDGRSSRGLHRAGESIRGEFVESRKAYNHVIMTVICNGLTHV